MLTLHSIQCPYCGERIDIQVDASAGEQRYIEDCQVCCRPIGIEVWLDADEDVQVNVRSEDEA